jgi:formiminotetrahydrofolate cyclodeaminase
MDGRADETLTAFLDRLASGVPAPGGGAAAALAGATAAALVAMACRVTARRTPSESIVAASESAEACRDQLLTLMREDADAYEAVVEARRAPPERRASLVQSAMQRATAVPLNTAGAACGVLELCATILDAVRPSTVGDLGVAIALGTAAVNASTLTVRINLQDISDGHVTLAVRQSLERVELRAGALRELAERIAARAGLAGLETGRSA